MLVSEFPESLRPEMMGYVVTALDELFRSPDSPFIKSVDGLYDVLFIGRVRGPVIIDLAEEFLNVNMFSHPFSEERPLLNSLKHLIDETLEAMGFQKYVIKYAGNDGKLPKLLRPAEEAEKNGTFVWARPLPS